MIFHQVKYSLVFRLLGVISVFLLTRELFIRLGVEGYGAWSLIYAVISWVSLFDLGITNSLRNELVLIRGVDGQNADEETRLVSAAFGISVILFLAVTLFSVLLYIFFDVGKSLNVDVSGFNIGFSIALIYVGTVILINPLKARLFSVKKADQVVLINVLPILFLLFSVYVFDEIKSLQGLCLLLILSVMLGTIYSFLFIDRKCFSFMRIEYFFERKIMRRIIASGFVFFLLQVLAILLYSSDRFFIQYFLGETSTANYDLALRIFNIVIIISTVISAPVWTRFTNLYKSNDVSAIKILIRKLETTGFLLFILVIMLSLFLRPIIILWVSSELLLSNREIYLLGLYVLLIYYLGIYCAFLNGSNILNFQLNVMCLLVLIKVIVVYIFRQSMNFSLLIFISCMVLLIMAIVLKIRVRRETKTLSIANG